MSRGIKIPKGISNWVRESAGPEAGNRGRDEAGDDEADEEAADDDALDKRDSPVCCSAASNSDLTVLDQ